MSSSSFTALCVLASSLLGRSTALFSCADIKDCGKCVDHEELWSHLCFWCEIDQGCHDITSLVSPCTPGGSSIQCISKSIHKDCSKHDTASCSDNFAMKPVQIHIALAGPDGMRIAWKTQAKPKNAAVRFSVNFTHDAGTVVPAERSVQYLASQGGHGYHHVAKLSGLAPGTRYEYRIECDGVTSKARSFETAAHDLAEASFLMLGDMGFGANGKSLATRKRLDALKGQTDLTIIAGDIAYADDSFVHKDICSLEFCYETVYDNYMQDMENVMDSKPFMTAVGNHESECHSPACTVSSDIKESLRNFSAYNARFAMPSPESGGSANMWYSFDYASVHFTVINTETDFKGAEEENYGDSCGPSKGLSCMASGHFAKDGEYLRWLEADLKAANEQRTEQRPWLVAVGHRPWLIGDFEKGSGLMTVDLPTKQAHAALFEKYGVDLYITGHVHSYHRLKPINNNKATPVVVTGGAGCDEMDIDKRVDYGNTTDLWDYRMMTAKTQVGILQASTSALTWKAIYSDTGEVFDTMTIKKKRGFDKMTGVALSELVV